MTSPMPDLQSSLKVQPDGDQIQVTVTLPAELTNDFVHLLESLTRLAHSVRIKSHHQQRVVSDHRHHLDQKAQQNKQEYYQRLRHLFDRFADQGLNRQTIIKKISAVLRKNNHPWSSPDLVRSSLSAAGRSGRPGRPRRQS